MLDSETKIAPEDSLHEDTLKACGIPYNTWGATWLKVNSEVRVRLQQCYGSFAKYVSEGRGLYLFGDYGRGKTALASILARRWVATARQPCYWIRATDYPNIVIKERQLNEFYTVAEWCEETPLLVIDEFQIRDTIKYSETVIEELFRRRVDRKKSTIFTTNVIPSVLEKAYPAMHAVLREGAVPVRVDGEDKRVAIGNDTVSKFFK